MEKRNRGNYYEIGMLRDYKDKIELELDAYCTDCLLLLDDYILPKVI